jgi:hypothetical protein
LEIKLPQCGMDVKKKEYETREKRDLKENRKESKKKEAGSPAIYLKLLFSL